MIFYPSSLWRALLVMGAAVLLPTALRPLPPMNNARLTLDVQIEDGSFLQYVAGLQSWHDQTLALRMLFGNTDVLRGVYDPDDVDTAATAGLAYNFTSGGSAISAAHIDFAGNYLAYCITTSVLIYRTGNGLDFLPSRGSVSSSPAETLNSIRWHPNGKFLIAGGLTANAFLFAFDRQSETPTFLTAIAGLSGSPVPAVDWSPDGQYCITIDSSTGLIRVFRFNQNNPTAAPTQVASITDLGTTRNLVAWSPDGNHIAVGGDDATVRFYSFAANNIREVTSITPLVGSTVKGMSWNPDGSNLAIITATGSRLFVANFDGITASTAYQMTLGNTPSAVAWSSVGAYLAVAGTSTASLQFFGIQSAGLVPVSGATKDHGATLKAVAWSPDENQIFVGGDVGTGSNSARIYALNEDLDVGMQKIKSVVEFNDLNVRIKSPGSASATLIKQEGGTMDHGVTLSSCAWHPSERFVAIAGGASAGKGVRIYELSDSIFTEVTSLTTTLAKDVTWSPDGKYLAVAQNTLSIYQFDGNSLSFTTSINGSLSINRVDWSADSRFLAVADSTVMRLYQWAPGSLSQVDFFDLGVGPVRRVRFSPDSVYLAISYDTDLILIGFGGSFYDHFPYLLDDFIFPAGSGPVDIAWHPSRNYLAAVCSNTSPATGFLILFSVEDATFAFFSTLEATDHTDALNSVDWDPSGSYVVATGHAGVASSRLRFFSLQTTTSNKPLNTKAHLLENTSLRRTLDGDGLSFRWSPGGGYMLATGGSKTQLFRYYDRVTGPYDRVPLQDPFIDQFATDALVTVSHAPTAFPPELDTIDHGPANIHFSSSTITLSYQLNISTNHTLNIHASGVINGNGHTIHFADPQGASIILDAGISVTLQNMTIENFTEGSVSLGSGSSLFFGNNTTVELGQSQNVVNPWRFAGYATLKGNGYTLRPGVDPAYVSVDQGGRLLFENIIIENVQSNNLRGLAADTSLVFKNCHLALANDFSLTVGSLLFQGDVIVSGTSEFSYRSSTSSSIDTNGRLILDTDTILTYSPGVNSKDLLFLTDSSSQLQFNGNTIRISTAGWRLTKGRLIVEGKTSIDSTATAISQAIELGDGIASHDIHITIQPGAALNLTNGFMNYLNVG